MRTFLQILREIRQIDPAFWTALVAISALLFAAYSIWITRVL